MDYLILRLSSSLVCGVLLSQAGSLIQLSSRNLLASPSTLGFDGLAIFWVMLLHSLSMWFGADISWPSLIGVPAFVLLGLFFEKFFRGREQFDRVILLGLTFNLAVGAVFSLCQFLFLAFNLPFPVELWFGHFRFVTENHLLKLLVTELFFLLSLTVLWRDLQLYTLGKRLSRTFGLRERRLFSFIFIFIAVSTFVIVSSFGAFSFLGLVFPLVSRSLWFRKYDLKGELLWGGLFNGIIFMLVDYLCYELTILGAEIPVGLIGTGIGAVSLMFILWNSSHRELLAKPKK